MNTPFDISRIHTPQGIFRLKGEQQASPPKLVCRQLEILGSDGWLELRVEDNRTQVLLDALFEPVREHLKPCSLL
ncbi:hypothetical protein [Shewanella algae]|uniref:hypothetical protein n=1 Tax=Shewanella algae TaxID=38313 RepID=UPI0031F5A162